MNIFVVLLLVALSHACQVPLGEYKRPASDLTCACGAPECEPACTAPDCSIQCGMGATCPSFVRLTCTTVCPFFANSTLAVANECPACETQCNPLPPVCTGCDAVCAPITCTWNCMSSCGLETCQNSTCASNTTLVCAATALRAGLALALVLVAVGVFL